MASLIECPYCGLRPREEFTVSGDAAVERPNADDAPSAWIDYVYMRKNTKGVMQEHWHHTLGCRRWLVVTRNTVTHNIESVVDAAQQREQA
ncbi:MAG: sarcosine oxidase subunit delta family protein [Pseudomonadota bacterium]